MQGKLPRISVRRCSSRRASPTPIATGDPNSKWPRCTSYLDDCTRDCRLCRRHSSSGHEDAQGRYISGECGVWSLLYAAVERRCGGRAAGRRRRAGRKFHKPQSARDHEYCEGAQRAQSRCSRARQLVSRALPDDREGQDGNNRRILPGGSGSAEPAQPPAQ